MQRLEKKSREKKSEEKTKKGQEENSKRCAFMGGNGSLETAQSC